MKDDSALNELVSAIRQLAESVSELNLSINKLDTGEVKPTTMIEVSKSFKSKQSGLSIAVVGVRGHGQKHIANFVKLKNCFISYICDVDRRVGQDAISSIEEKTGYRPKLVSDIREVLRDKTVDAISISTPHHWHALATVWALQAGKHVYIEKPITHTYAERHSVLAAARKYGKVVQAGTQLRSNESLAAAGEYMRSGKLGDIDVVHCIIYKNRPNLPQSNEMKVPKSVDFDLWCGPSQEHYQRSKFHYHWHWYWEYGNGALGNNGIHRIDAARFALGLKGFGDLVLSYGGRFGPADSGETPNTQITIHKFGSTWVLQDALGLNAQKYRGHDNAVFFYGSKGTIVYAKGKAKLLDSDGREQMLFEGIQRNHYYNFLETIREKNMNKLRGDLEEGIVSGDLCHLGNISYRVGQMASDASIRALVKSIGAPEFIQDRLNAVRANLNDNEVFEDLRLGRVLNLSDSIENPIVNDDEASAYLNRTYRDGFELPSSKDV